VVLDGQVSGGYGGVEKMGHGPILTGKIVNDRRSKGETDWVKTVLLSSPVARRRKNNMRQPVC
jgi:hypothetical protein